MSLFKVETMGFNFDNSSSIPSELKKQIEQDPKRLLDKAISLGNVRARPNETLFEFIFRNNFIEKNELIVLALNKLTFNEQTKLLGTKKNNNLLQFLYENLGRGDFFKLIHDNYDKNANQQTKLIHLLCTWDLKLFPEKVTILDKIFEQYQKPHPYYTQMNLSKTLDPLLKELVQKLPYPGTQKVLSELLKAKLNFQATGDYNAFKNAITKTTHNIQKSLSSNQYWDKFCKKLYAFLNNLFPTSTLQNKHSFYNHRPLKEKLELLKEHTHKTPKIK